MKKYAVTTTEDLKILCVKNDWLTYGTDSQHEKLFRANKFNFEIEVIATIIWLCSVEEYCSILLKLRIERCNYWKRIFGIEDENQTYQVWDVFGVIREAPFSHIVDLLGDPNIDDFDYEEITIIYDSNGNTVWKRDGE